MTLDQAEGSVASGGRGLKGLLAALTGEAAPQASFAGPPASLKLLRGDIEARGSLLRHLYASGLRGDHAAQPRP